MSDLKILEKQVKFHKRMTKTVERNRPLCPDHRDKQAGKHCIVCHAEATESALLAALTALVIDYDQDRMWRCAKGGDSHYPDSDAIKKAREAIKLAGE